MIKYFMIPVFLFIMPALYGQMDPEKVCRFEDDRLVFTLNLKWSEQEKKEVSRIFELDTLLLAEVYGGKKVIVFDGVTWTVTGTGGSIIELSKPLVSDVTTGARYSDYLQILDKWIGFPGEADESDVGFGANDLTVPNAIIYNGTQAQFFLQGHKSARKVCLAGDFNNWSTTSTPMRSVGTGWITDVKLKPGKYAYKYIVDGQWATDPANLLREKGAAGAFNSVFYCHNHIFRLTGYRDARRVVVTGNFVNWNPRGLAMTRTTAGWALPVYLRDGTYSYKYRVDNRWITDPGNPLVREDANGNRNSFLEMGEPYLFKLEGFTSARKVSLAGSFNRWDPNELVMEKTASGWQLSYVVPAGNYEYKYIADGKWMIDPANPFTSGSGDLENSYIALKANHIFETARYPDARHVVVTGSFNGWNPEGYRMVKRGGTWRLPIFLKPGKYTYKYVVDGTWMTDPDNTLYEENEYGTENSVLWIGPQD